MRTGERLSAMTRLMQPMSSSERSMPIAVPLVGGAVLLLVIVLALAFQRRAR